MATSNYHKNLVDPVFSEVIPHFSSVEPVSETVYRSRILKIFAAGRFVRKKGFDLLLKAIPEVLASDCRIRFQIAGDGPEFDELKMLQTELKLEDKVQFLGFRDEGVKLCSLVVISVNYQGEKKFLTIEDGVRESTQSWCEMLLDLKVRGMNVPKLAVGDGALGF